MALWQGMAAKFRAAWRLATGGKDGSCRDASALAASGVDFDDFYFTLEQHFRGSEEDIFQRMQDSFAYIQREFGNLGQPALDIGCGRGEWLGVLAGQGIVASGIDSNQVMVEVCRNKGLSVRQADVFSHLRSLPDNALGFVSAFHIIEHIPVQEVLVLMQEIRRVLKPGGRVWLETPNPENLVVGAHRFYMDPTHQKPLPPDLVKFMLEYQGFGEVSVHRFQPVPEMYQVSGDDEFTRRFNHLMYGPQDYAVMGVKQA